MDATELIDSLAAEGTLLGAAAEGGGWDARVPHLEWTVRDTVVHLGGVHRWATQIVRTGEDDDRSYAAVGTGPDDAKLLDWFLAGHAALVMVLSEAPADLDAPTFLPAGSPLHFWARRQAHETAIHRADVESASGAVTAVPTNFAQDGIAELLLGFGARRSNRVATAATLGLVASDGPSWSVRFGGERITAEPTDSPADATVSGTSSDLYLWLWNRPSAASVAGEDVARLWSDTVAVTWS